MYASTDSLEYFKVSCGGRTIVGIILYGVVFCDRGHNFDYVEFLDLVVDVDIIGVKQWRIIEGRQDGFG